MKSIKKIVAVTLVTALCFIACCVPASASSVTAWDYLNEKILLPSPTYPDSEMLPYGDDTLIYDLYQRAKNGYICHRFYLKSDNSSESSISYANGLTVILTLSSTRYFNLFINSADPIYYEGLAFTDETPETIVSGGLTVYDTPNSEGRFALYFNGTMSFDEVLEYITYPLFYYVCQSNYPFQYGGRVITGDVINSIPSDELTALTSADMVLSNWATCTGDFHYLSDSERNEMLNGDLISSIGELENSVLNGFDDVIENNNQNADKIVGSIDSASGEIKDSIVNSAGEIQTAINGAVDDIMNGASEVPTVDTDNSWMNESVTKVNEWLSELEAFEEQMKQNEEENSENMQQASNFLNGFFESIPTAIKAACTLFLVVVVVVKMIGR